MNMNMVVVVDGDGTVILKNMSIPRTMDATDADKLLIAVTVWQTAAMV